MSTDPLLLILPELGSLPDAHRSLLKVAKRRHLASGALVFQEGQEARSLMGVMSGEVDVLRRFGSADRLIARLGPGALMGEAALVPGLARTASVRARGEVELVELPAEPVRAVLLGHPSLALALLGTVMRRLQRRDEAYLAALHQGLEDRQRELAVLRARQTFGEDPEEVWCPSLEPTLERARRLARSDLPVLIAGESGTGKELLARHVHRHSGRASQAMHSLNCAAIPGEIAEAELFGVRRGAFTGATQDRPGLFKAAHRGTLFLDEIGDLPLGQQAKLLRALQDGSFYPVGSQQPEQSDVRLLSASNKDLEREVRAGRFREDLYYRIAGARLELPPLRDRPDHIPLLIDWVLGRAVPEADPAYASQEIRPLLLRYRWPGNVRELMNVLRAGLALTPEFPRLRAADLPEALRVEAERALAGIGPGASAGADTGLGASASAGAGAGIGLGASASAGAGAGIGLGAGTSLGAGAGAGLGPGLVSMAALSPSSGPVGSGAVAAFLAGRSLSGCLRDVTKSLLLAALEETGGVRKEAAALLGITPQNLANYLRRLDLHPPGGLGRR